MDLESIIPTEHKHFNQIIFTGRVLPEFPSLDLTNPVVYSFNGYDGTMLYGSVAMKNSLIQIIVRTNSPDITTVRNYATAQTRIVLDVFGYLHGYYFFADVQMATLADGKQVVFDTSYPALQTAAATKTLTVIDLLGLCWDEPLRLALADIRYAMESSLETGFFCYRAVESIMQGFKAENDNDAKGWQKMHESLHTSKAYIEQRLKPQSDVRRHGSVGFITSAERDRYILSTAEVIDRYSYYLRDGKKALDATTFPVLTP